MQDALTQALDGVRIAEEVSECAGKAHVLRLAETAMWKTVRRRESVSGRRTKGEEAGGGGGVCLFVLASP
jgi:hypothetical protein